jgi:hypothetical protein
VYASLVDRQPTLEDFLASIGRLGFVDAHGETDLDAWQEWFFTE